MSNVPAPKPIAQAVIRIDPILHRIIISCATPDSVEWVNANSKRWGVSYFSVGVFTLYVSAFYDDIDKVARYIAQEIGAIIK